MYINKAMIFGNLTRDPELRALPSGMNVVNFSVATNRTYKDRDGKKQEQADFHNVVVFGRQADTVNQYLKKGSSVFVEGRMQTRSWEGKDGEKKYRTEIVADRVQFGPRGSGGGARSSDSGQGGDDQTPPDDTSSGGGAGIEYPKDDINPDDIPF
ncbi:single-stranded DNA-binding protein [Candidatus Kaiserbacteria bacterium RIFCSPHIGHO2_01_FULL_54_36]|uniref:Single-stranded DNA-binding protein n=1 Tax=Candidatus Kaiserbacteria bacterium RIFCSPHIGHO2_01_FULL_54_36 TaxID=1798482 RepID=A0A1F6CM83_9BACT|nr:MAG: single-stranded DNA-binding protein [Candidatus Kaiserbacteria bacterium RIFCSPHIGHO2_01_FULL_54_36]OGG75817.1 MAG: single-stranded DNA-binding protein [Candidatus Kaiserbacteria bacterium RIFCSPLOWO2_01_FULL_54_22]